MNQYIVAVGNSNPNEYECFRIHAKNRDQAIFRAGTKAYKKNWKLLSIEVAKNKVPMKYQIIKEYAEKNGYKVNELQTPDWYKNLKKVATGGIIFCPNGGVINNDCEGCAYSGDYHFDGIDCVKRGSTVNNGN